MSWQPALDPVCLHTERCDPVDLIIAPEEHDLGAFSVRRVLPAAERQMVGPFIFFDEMGPALLDADTPLDVRPHPHIGLATLTWLFEGAILHRDSLGYEQEIRPGEVNWMTAGAGIVHSERTPERLKGQPARLHGLQVWMALPEGCEEVAPSFQHYGADDIPTVGGDGWQATVVAGCAWGVTSPVSVYSETLYADIRLSAGKTLPIGAEHAERAVYLIGGALRIAGETFEPGRMLVLTPGLEVTAEAAADSRFVLVGGAAMTGTRYKVWNFVSSSRDRIDRAKADWRARRFPTVPGDETEFIPLPDHI